jgi:hypothetical protein
MTSERRQNHLRPIGGTVNVFERFTYEVRSGQIFGTRMVLIIALPLTA